MEIRLILASASPARRRLLEAAGIDPEVIVSGVDESVVDAASTEAQVVAEKLARLKAQAVAAELGHREATLVLGCDSVLAFEGEALGKPRDAAEATQRWRRMRGREGILYTGHCLIDIENNRTTEGVAGTTVHFAELTDEEIAAYVATGEPLNVAGAFTIDGLGGPFVERIEGDHGNVIGLSLPLLRILLSGLNQSITALWRDRVDA
jgi:septum formation protein